MLRTHGRSDGRLVGQRENSIPYPPTNTVCRGYNNYVSLLLNEGLVRVLSEGSDQPNHLPC